MVSMIVSCGQLLVLAAFILKVLVICTCRPIRYDVSSYEHHVSHKLEGGITGYGAEVMGVRRSLMRDLSVNGRYERNKVQIANKETRSRAEIKGWPGDMANRDDLQSKVGMVRLESDRREVAGFTGYRGNMEGENGGYGKELKDEEVAGLAAGSVARRRRVGIREQEGGIEEARLEGVSALLVFGDSTVDAGTNKHLLTVSRSDFPPYGRDLASKQPTGRFCNGLLVTDYLASLMGLQAYTKAYLDIRKHARQELKIFDAAIAMEVSFASASSGIYDNTAQHFNVVSLSKQLEHFKEYREMLIRVVGKEECLEILRKAVFVISTGTNDFLNNYHLNPYLRAKYSYEDFQDMLLGLCDNFIKELYILGARRIGVVSLPPFGCLPATMTLYMHDDVGCVDHLNEQAFQFNTKLRRRILLLKQKHTGLNLAYMDTYNVLIDAIQNPNDYGLTHAQKACCGSGKLEVGLFCNKLTLGTCEDASSYVFWDSFHSSDRMNQILALDLFEQLRIQLFIK